MPTLLQWIEAYWDALLAMTAEMAPYLLLGFLIAGLLHAFVPRTLYSRHLSKPTMGSVLKAAALGVPLPLCSCGVIPTTVGLRREGASEGACTSFLIATPQTGVDSIVATYSLMGPAFAIIRPVAALFTALFGGWLVNRHGHGSSAEATAHAHAGETEGECHDHHDGDVDSCACHHHHEHTPESSNVNPWRSAFSYAFVEMMEDVGKWLVVGLLIAALITVSIPDGWLASLHDYKLLNMLLVLAIAIPMYVCATGSIPIAVSLMAKGLTPGAALVFLMAGPAVNSASMLVVGKVFGRRTLKLYILSIVIGAVAFGLGIDYLLPQEWFAVQSSIAGHGAHCHTALSPWEWLWIAVLVVLLVNAFVRSRLGGGHHHDHGHCCGEGSCGCRHHGRHDHGHAHADAEAETVTTYHVAGMSCGHCRASVKSAIADVAGVESVSVDLSSGRATVHGRHDPAAVVAAVEARGYDCTVSEE